MLTDKITISTLISGLIDYMFIVIFCLMGAVVKDTYNTITEKDTKVKIPRILISTLVSSIFLFSISDFIMAKITWRSFVLPCFISGGLGFELFGKLTKLEVLFSILARHNTGEILKTLAEDKQDHIECGKNKDPTKEGKG